MTKPPYRRKKATSALSTDSSSSASSANEDISQQEENPATATITVTAVEVPELTELEQSDRLLLERKVERAFFEAGKRSLVTK